MSTGMIKADTMAGSPPSSYTKRKYGVAKYLTKMNERDKAENNKIIKTMETKINFLKNPRFKINRPPIMFSQGAIGNINDNQNPFRVVPDVVVFTDYKPNSIYQIPLTVTNAGALSHRFKYMPPGSPEFSVSSVSYPLNSGLIAPGMSVTLNINFMANSMSDYDDELLLISEECSFVVKLQARKEHPILNLPDVWDCQSCWLGDRIDMVFPFINKGGEGSFKFFCENEEDDAKQSGDILKINHFTIFPSEFYIGKGQSMELFVSFIPQNDGVITENVILACDNNTSKIYGLKAIANMVQLQVMALNGNLLSTETASLKRIHFQDIDPMIQKTNTLTLRNEASVKVNYRWVVKPDEDNPIYKQAKLIIDPEKGVFQGDSTIDFKMTFAANLSIPFYKQIALIIDDIPFKGIRNPPEIIKNQFLDQKNNQEAIRPSITYYEFELCALVNSNKLHIDPKVYIFPGLLLMNHQYSKIYTITNLSEGAVPYEIRLYNKTEYIQYSINQVQGTLKPKSKETIELKIWGTRPSTLQKCVFIAKFENSNPLSFEICGEFTGPKIKIQQSEIDFGLMRTFSNKEFILDIENLTEIEASILIKKLNDQITFSDYRNEEDKYYQWWDEKIYFSPQYYTLKPLEKAKFAIRIKSDEAESINQLVHILVDNGDSHLLNLSAEVQDIHVCLNRYTIELPTLYAGNAYTVTPGDIQNIIIENYGNLPTKFEWKAIDTPELYANFYPREGIIDPKSKLNIAFEFTPKVGQKLEHIFLCHVEGLNNPIGFELIAQVDGLSVAYECIEDVIIGNPNSTASPTSRAGKTTKTSFMSQLLSQKPEKSALKMNVTANNKSNNSRVKFFEEKPPVPFEKIELLDLKINQPKVMKFLLKNTSGISTTFNFYMENYEPLNRREPTNLHSRINSNTSNHKSIDLTQIQHHNQPHYTSKRHGTFYKDTKIMTDQRKSQTFSGSLLTDQIEKTQNFSSINGQEMNKQKVLSREQKFFLTSNKGVAVVCEPTKGNLHPHEQIMITVTIYNDTCGKFEDFLCSEIKGLPKMKFPVLLNISGSPLIVTPNQVGVDYQSDYPTMLVANIMTNSPMLSKQVKLTNTGPYDLELEWRVFMLNQNPESKENYFNIKIVEPDLGKNDLVKVLFDPIEPEEATEGTFAVKPKLAKIKGRDTSIFTITFAGQELGEYKGVIVAKPRLCDDKNQSRKDYNLGLLPVYLEANTIHPVLTLDKRSMSGGIYLVKFEKWALCSNKKEERHIIFKNKTTANLIFNVRVEGPFKLIDSKTNSNNKYEFSQTNQFNQGPETSFNLSPSSLLELIVKFIGYQEKDLEHWPIVPTITYTGIIYITYANGDIQTIQLEGELLRPVFSLNSRGFEGKPLDDIIDFDIVHIKDIQEKSIFLSNRSKVTGNWKINYVKYPMKKLAGLSTITRLEQEDSQKTDDPTVFTFSLSQGTLAGPTKPVNMVPKGAAFTTINTKDEGMIEPLEIIISFQPKKNILYKSKYRITIEEGQSIEFVLKGTGTYEENMRKSKF